jgi:hypothetical protein
VRDCVRQHAYLPGTGNHGPREAHMSEDRDQIQISVRMPADLVSALEKRAEGADRTLSAELRRIARRAVAEPMEEAA